MYSNQPDRIPDIQCHEAVLSDHEKAKIKNSYRQFSDEIENYAREACRKADAVSFERTSRQIANFIAIHCERTYEEIEAIIQEFCNSCQCDEIRDDLIEVSSISDGNEGRWTITVRNTSNNNIELFEITNDDFSHELINLDYEETNELGVGGEIIPSESSNELQVPNVGNGVYIIQAKASYRTQVVKIDLNDRRRSARLYLGKQPLANGD